MRRLKKILKWLGVVLLVVLLLAGVFLWVLLRTDYGKEKIRVAVLNYLDKNIFEAGGVEFSKLEGDLLHTIVLHDVVIKDNRDKPMIKTDCIRAEIDLWALLDKKVHIKQAVSTPVEIRVQYDEVKGEVYYPIVKPAPKEEQPPSQPSTTQKPWLVIVDRFTTQESLFAYEEIDAQERGVLPVYEATKIRIDAGVVIYPDQIKIYVHDSAALPYSMQLGGAIYQGVNVKGELTYYEDHVRYDWVDATIGSSHLYLKGYLRISDIYNDITILPSYLLASDLRRALPDVPILTSLQAEGSVKGHLNDLASELNLTAPGGGNAKLKYVMNIEDPRISWGLSAKTEDFDLATWLGGVVPHSTLEAEIGAVGSGFSDDFQRFRLLAKGEVDGVEGTEARVSGSYRFGVLRLDEIWLGAPGNEVLARANYSAQAEQGGVVARLDVSDISSLPIPVEGLAGAVFGDVSLKMDGPQLSSNFTLRASGARYEDYRAGLLQAKGNLGFNLEDNKPSGTVTVNGSRLDVAGLALSQARLKVSPDPKDPLSSFILDTDATLPTGEEASFDLLFSLTKESTNIGVRRGELRLPDKAPFAVGPAKVKVLDDRATWEGVTLHSPDGGALSSSGAYYFESGTIKATAETKALEVPPLLRMFGVNDVPLQGALESQISLKGDPTAPQFEVKGSVINGQIAGLPLKTIEAKYDGKRISYGINADDPKNTLYATGSAPVSLYQGRINKGPLESEIHMREVDIDDLKSFIPEEYAAVQGRVSLDLTATGDSYDPTIDATVTLLEGSYDVWQNIQTRFHIVLDDEKIHTDMEASLDDTKLLTAAGTVYLPWQKVLDAMETLDLGLAKAPLEVDVLLENIDLEALRPKLPKEYQESIPLTTGLLRTNLEITGQIGTPNLDFSGNFSGITARVNDQDIKDMGLDWSFVIDQGEPEDPSDATAELSGNFIGMGAKASFQASAPADLDTVLDLLGPNSTEVMNTLPIGAVIAVEGLELQELPWSAFGGKPAELDYLKKGVIGGEFGIVGTPASPSIRYIAAIEDAFIIGEPGMSIVDAVGPFFIALDGTYEEDGMNTELTISKESELWFTGTLGVDFPLREALAYAEGVLPAKNPTYDLDLNSDQIKLEDVVTLLNVQEPAGGAFSMNVGLSGVVPLVGETTLPQGSIRVLSGEKNSPTAKGLSLGSSSLGYFDLLVTLLPAPAGRPGAAPVALTLKANGSEKHPDSTLTISVPTTIVDFTKEKPLDEKAEVRMIAHKFDLGFVKLVNDDIKRLEGTLSTNTKRGGLVLRDPMGDATLEGSLILSDVEMTLAEVYQRVDELDAELQFSAKKTEPGATEVAVKKFSLRSGEGLATLGGELDLHSLVPQHIGLTITAQEFEVPYSGTLMAKLTGFEADIDGTIEEKKLDMKIGIKRGSYDLPSLFSESSKDLMPLGMPDDIVIVETNEIQRGRSKPEPPPTPEPTSGPSSQPAGETPPAESPFSYTIVIDIEDKLFINNPPPEAKGMVSKLSIQVGGQIKIESNGEGLGVVGELQLLEGSEVTLINSPFLFSEGSIVTFIGSDNPILNLSATSDIAASGGETGAEIYRVKLDITGTAEAPIVDWSSEPFLEKAAILQLILTGKINSATDVGQQNLLQEGINATMQALGNSVAQLAVGLLIQNSPLAFLTDKTLKVGNVEFNLLDLIRADLEELELGRHVGKRCYLNFFLRRNTETVLTTDSNNFEADFSCRITRNTGLNFRAGTSVETGNSNGSADIVWSKDYD